MGWSEILTVFAVIATNLGTVLALFMHSDRKLDEHRKETNAILEAIRQEMRDFHGRLCAIEESRKK